MKIKYLLLISFFTVIASAIQAQNVPEKFRIIGYFKGDLETEAEQINYRKITQLNIAFINPDSMGNFADVKGLKDVVKDAHKHKVKVLAAIGGGRTLPYLGQLMSPLQRTLFVDHISKLMTDYSLDGIDIDIEGVLLTADYEGFITELAPVIKAKGLLTVAVATSYGKRYTKLALQQFDQVNIMSYDKTGPWRPTDPGAHAPLAMAVADLDYWQNEKGIAKEKLNLGVPFYGYSFGPEGTGSMSYRKIMATYPDFSDKDELQMENGSTLYYNGKATIKSKVKLALEQVGGIMIWQLMQDAYGSESLLNLINKETTAQAAKK